jgi:flagellar biosynthesis protein FlhB
MAGKESEQDRTEKASPFKLREAKKRGQVAKSQEFTAWAIMLAATCVVHIFSDELLQRELKFAAGIFSQSGDITLTVHNTLHLFVEISTRMFSSFGFIVITVLACGLLINFFQTGPVFSWQPLKADFSRINPVAGFKRLFNIRIVYELIKVLLKFGILIGVTFLFFHAKLTSVMQLMNMEAAIHPAVILEHAVDFSLWLLAAFAVTAIVDFAFMKWEYAKNLRMSRREQKDEVKNREGDPQVKAKIRELQREAAKRGASLQRIPEADVLITNPTHLSVAIRYERGRMLAPIVIAKGAGELALKMRIKAQQHRVPLQENKSLARSLFKRVQIDQPIHPETYSQVAAILTAIYRKKNRGVA